MSKSSHAPDYFCTWLVQGRKFARDNYPYTPLYDAWCKYASDMIDEENLFGNEGWTKAYPMEMRRNLYFLLDSGWDIPYGTVNAQSLSFGSLIPDPERFPSTARLAEADKLKWIADRILELGWKGVGIWIPAHEVNQLLQGTDAEQYWREKILQSKYAGVNYWKIDWGEKMLDVKFRGLLTRLGAELHPELWIEHALVPTGQTNDGKRTGRFAEPHKIQAACEELEFADVFRTYDCTWSLPHTVTISRVAEIMLTFGNRKCNGTGYLNLESCAYLALALGGTFGTMVPPDSLKLPEDLGKRDDSMSNERLGLDEPLNAILCRKKFIPEAAGLDKTVNHVSDVWLEDEFPFPEIYGDEAGLNHIKVPQAITRGTALPDINDIGDGTPLFAATMYPGNDTLVIAILPRAVRGIIKLPLAEIRMKLDIIPKQIIVFGSAAKLDFVLPANTECNTFSLAPLSQQDDSIAELPIVSNTITIGNAPDCPFVIYT